MSTIVIDNSKESSVGGVWSNPGAGLYDRILESPNYKSLLKETYIVSPVDRINNTDEDKTSFSASGMGYPHHVIRGDKLVLHRTGLRAAYSRAQQQGIVSGEKEAHFIRHYKEMGWYEESTISNEEVEHSVDLKHYGVLGMKWGVRKDRERSSKPKREPSPEHKQAKELRRKRVTEMTNAELKQLNERLQLERNYKQLTSKDTKNGKGFIDRQMKRQGNRVADKAFDEGIKAAVPIISGVVTGVVVPYIIKKVK